MIFYVLFLLYIFKLKKKYSNFKIASVEKYY